MKICIVDSDEHFNQRIIWGIAHYTTYSSPSVVFSIAELTQNVLARLDILFLALDSLQGIGVDDIRRIRKQNGHLRIIVITHHSELSSILGAIRAGASGYLLKSISEDRLEKKLIELEQGIHPLSADVLDKIIQSLQPELGKIECTMLSEREKDVVRGITAGLSYKEISEQLFVSISTIQSHIKRIYKKLNVNSKADVVRKVLQGEI